MSYKTHLFICTNAPDNPNKCGSKGSESLRKSLKEKCGAAFGKEVRINASGCLGPCERGINAVMYPQGEWFHELKATPEDEQKLFEAVKKSQERG